MKENIIEAILISLIIMLSYKLYKRCGSGLPRIEDKKIEKMIPTSLKGIDNLDEKIEIAHIDTISAIDKINEIIDKINGVNKE